VQQRERPHRVSRAGLRYERAALTGEAGPLANQTRAGLSDQHTHRLPDLRHSAACVKPERNHSAPPARTVLVVSAVAAVAPLVEGDVSSRSHGERSQFAQRLWCFSSMS
jgi:hypothetical protein